MQYTLQVAGVGEIIVDIEDLNPTVIISGLPITKTTKTARYETIQMDLRIMEAIVAEVIRAKQIKRIQYASPKDILGAL